MFSQLSYKTQKRILIVSFLIVPLALLITFSFVPLVNLLRYSLFEWDGYGTDMKFVGIRNYIELFTRPELFGVYEVSLYYLLGSVAQTVFAMYFATILSFKVKGRNFFKGVLFFPYLLNGVVIGFIFLNFFRPEGTLDTILGLIGLGDHTQYWLRNPRIINFSLAAVSVWRYMGFQFILYLGSIQSISPELYEAAEMDGANKWQQFKYIIFPSIRKVVELTLILSISGAISVFEIPYIMTKGGNGSATFVIETVDMAFKNMKVGLASAMAFVLFLIVVAVTIIQKLAFRERRA